MRDRSDLGTYIRDGSSAGLRYERRYDRPVETVWKALTEPARLADWMGEAQVDPYVGGRYELFIDTPQPMRGRVVTWQPPQLLEFSWQAAGTPSAVVRCELTPDGAGTRLIFMHRAFRFAASCLSLGVFRMTDFKQQTSLHRRFANIGLVFLIHAGLLYALLTGLGHSVIQVLRPPADVQLIEPDKPVDTPPPLPVPPRLLPTPLVPIPLPEIKLAMQSPLQQVTTDIVPPPPPAREPEEKQPVQPVRTAPVIDAKRACTLPQYPAASIRNNEQGTVDLDFLIDVDGRVADSKVAASSGHSRLDEAARAALSLCRFTPGTVDGKPERSWGHLLYRWHLDG